MPSSSSKKISNQIAKLLSKEEQVIFSKVLLSKIPLLAAYIDANIQYRYMNTTYEAWFGVQAEDCIGRSLAEVLGDTYFAGVKEFFARALEGREQKFETEIDCKNGSSKTLEVHYIPDFNSSAAVVGVIVIAQDISDRRKSATNAERFEKVFRFSPNPILVFSDTGILECNEAAIKILGFDSKNELLQHHPAEFSPEYQPDGRSSKEKSQEMDRLAEVQGSHVFEWVHQKRDGTEILVEVSLSHVNWGDKNALLVIWNDLSDKRRRELQMIQTSKLASLGEMSAGIAHEINNPLAIIVGSLSLLDRLKNDPARFLAKVESMQRSCERISKIVSGLKKFSRSGEFSVMSEFSLGAIVKEAMVLLESMLSRSGCQIIFEIEEDCIVHCNEIEIEQVIVNLVNNAADAIKNCEAKWIKISIFPLPEAVVLRVMDSGPGIPENIRRKLFDPFFTTKRVGEGTGLGLSISKGILDEHEATISIVEKSSNTCFEIRFPRVVKIAKSA